MDVPLTGADGQQALDSNRNPMSRRIFIGTERNMLETASHDYRQARKQRGALSIIRFMSGYGDSPYDPEAVWSRSTLAPVRIRMCMFALATVLAAIMTLYVAASSWLPCKSLPVPGAAPLPVATSTLFPD